MTGTRKEMRERESEQQLSSTTQTLVLFEMRAETDPGDPTGPPASREQHRLHHTCRKASILPIVESTEVSQLQFATVRSTPQETDGE
ncbi:hypothetical protein EOD39_13003 [Acipenser ruthenus]|uniref:Uncharacterized protein n=1 Tax=Acipenser ruthenus TaxID=7906 RepID=A0A444UJQ2_ACIRT|nr:hypothetical protein EOD39_13003 [Acipenser ruthenus]